MFVVERRHRLHGPLGILVLCVATWQPPNTARPKPGKSRRLTPVVARRLFSDHMVSAQPPVWLHHPPLALLCRSRRTTTQAAARSPSAAGLCVLAQVPNVMEGIVKKIKIWSFFRNQILLCVVHTISFRYFRFNGERGK